MLQDVSESTADRTRYFAASALLPQGFARDVVIEVDGTGDIAEVRSSARGDAVALRGVAVPGMPNLHSHAFQRAMAGLAERAGAEGDDFWSWREIMYRFLARLSPDDVEAIATELYVELLKQGYTAVAEFHYLHNDPSGQPYADRAELAHRIVAAAASSGIGVTLLPVLYQASQFGGAPATAGQRRFVLATDALLDMIAGLMRRHGGSRQIRLGLAPHSLRAVAPDALRAAVAAMSALDPNAPIHIHVAEQVKELEDCLAWSGRRPIEWVIENLPVDRRWCLVHCTQSTTAELRALAASRAVVGLCPTTEANLGDGIFPLLAWLDTSGALGIGGDAHVATSPVEELRWLEYGQRLVTRRRNVSERQRGASTGASLYRRALAPAISARSPPGGAPTSSCSIPIIPHSSAAAGMRSSMPGSSRRAAIPSATSWSAASGWSATASTAASRRSPLPIGRRSRDCSHEEGSAMTENRRLDNARRIAAPRGSEITCRSWQTEAALRMLMNNLDPVVGERPEELVVYGGIGRAARDWACYDAIVAALRRLGPTETLLVQSGKPVGIVETHEDAPRVLIANSNLVGKWSTWEHFHELDRRGLMMYGQMTAGSWIYIGSQGIIQGTYETFAEAGRQHYGGELRGRWILTAGLGGMGGAQPLAATMAGASLLAVECRPSRIERRLETGYLDRTARDLDQALAIIAQSSAARRPVSVGLLGNAAEIFPEIARRVAAGEERARPDLITDQTSAHDPLNGYLPAGWTLDQHERMRQSDPQATERAAKASMAVQVRAMLALYRLGIPTLDYGNNIREAAREMGVADAFAFPGFVPAYIRPMFCRGRGPFRWAALSGDPEDIYRTDACVKALFPEDSRLHAWLDMAREKIRFQGLPARICWLGLGERAKAGLAFNDMVAKGELKAPIVIGRDHLDSGSVASPHRETEAMRDGSDAVADWPLLNALVNCASGATWVSIHNGGGVGIGYSQHAGMVIVADGSAAAALRLQRVLTNDPASGVMRHADAGYELAIDCAHEYGLQIPMLAPL